MKIEASDSSESCKACKFILSNATTNVVWQNDLWILRHTGRPYAELGWMTLHTKRHVPAFTQLSDNELKDFGPVSKKVSDAIIEVTGAKRVYIATLTESTPHVHAHFAPRYEDGPKGWETFQLKAKPGTRYVSEDDVRSVIEKVGEILSKQY